jgi:hypothetical protein
LACSEPAPNLPPIVINVFQTGSGGASVGPGTGNQGGSKSNGGSTGTNGGSGGSANGFGGLYAHCGEFVSGQDPPVETACDLDALEDGGDLTGTISSDRTLETGHFYTLKGEVKVAPGATLTVEPCVKVMGEDPDAVLVMQSSALGDITASCTYDGGTIDSPPGRLVAVGEPMAPIIFTSTKAPGARKPGDWGGVLLLGNARNDLAQSGVRVPIEGLAQAECHGYHTDEHDDESSGHLEYVRIEYASRQVGEASETNALTLGSVGSGTVMSHVMVSNSNDDCFEWFGGKMDADHLIALNCDDDMFDVDNGFSGKLQFLFGRQFPTSSEMDPSGMEIDGGAGKKTAPTTVAIANYAICGGGATDVDGKDRALALRSQSQPNLMNGFVTGFSAEAYYNDNTASPTVTHTRAFGNKTLGATEAFLAGPGNSPEEPDRFCDCWANPPQPIAATPIEGAAPTGFPDESASYLGAFEDASPGSNWMKGLWVDWSDK